MQADPRAARQQQLGTQHVRCRHRQSLCHLAVGLFAIGAIERWPAPPRNLPAPPRAPTATQIAADPDQDLDMEKPISRSHSKATGAGLPKAAKSSPGGYDSQRIQRFWRHYRGGKPEPKEHKRKAREYVD